MNHLTKLVEAALFSAAQPLSLADLKALDPDLGPGELREAVDALREHYESQDHAFELVELADGFQLLTRPEYAEAITQARMVSRPRKLSGAAMETLAIIAYRQPVGRAEIEEIRGVAADGVLKSLQERGFLVVTGRGDGLGRPLLYGTTPRFLEMLGLTELSELPRLDQLSVALRPLGAGLPSGTEWEPARAMTGEAPNPEQGEAETAPAPTPTPAPVPAPAQVEEELQES